MLGKISYIFLFFTLLNASKENPFSQINIKSQRAVCKKNKNDKNFFDFTYFNKVFVKFADDTQITCNKLKIILNAKYLQNYDKKLQKNVVEKIRFKTNVKFVKNNKTIFADKAEVFIDKKECHLQGNVKIEQKKQTEMDFPISTFCDKAIINFKNEKLTLEGNIQKPVNTILAIGEKSNIFKNKKFKKKHEQNKSTATK